MTATIEHARDDILSLLTAAWAASSVTNTLKLFYWDIPEDTPKTDSLDGQPPAWARVSVRHTGSAQATLSGDTGKRRWRRLGFVTIQIFTATGSGLSASDKIAMVAMAAYEGVSTTSGIWFRNVRPIEIGPDGVWFQTNVIADFEYDEVR